ncbi:MAG: hypothetical protein EOO51_12085 [Flavobacterium sp.]|nr:MAG: hypothetical protein EOO51_12085 [Flavobacterium sp.]
MRKFAVIICCLFGIASGTSQINELGLFLGGSNYIGDVGATNYIRPNEPAIGIVYKWNRSPRHAYRFSFTMAKIKGDDAEADSNGRKLRGYRFENNLKELSAGLEFNFFDFNLHELERKFTPYVYTGISYLIYDELFIVDGETKKDYTSTTFAIPMLVGLKSNITPSLVLGLETGARYSFSDNLDASNPKNDNLAPLRFGNTNSKDWYVFTGFTLTYTFGEKPCYCAD